MSNSIALVTLVVRDYDEAISYFITVLRFHLVEDTTLSDSKRWVVVSPSASPGTGFLLARATNPEQESRIGNQTGGRVAFFLNTVDFQSDYRHMQAHGVDFIDPPREEPYGTVVVFRDLYGNKWDLVERK